MQSHMDPYNLAGTEEPAQVSSPERKLTDRWATGVRAPKQAAPSKTQTQKEGLGGEEDHGALPPPFNRCQNWWHCVQEVWPWIRGSKHIRLKINHSSRVNRTQGWRIPNKRKEGTPPIMYNWKAFYLTLHKVKRLYIYKFHKMCKMLHWYFPNSFPLIITTFEQLGYWAPKSSDCREFCCFDSWWLPSGSLASSEMWNWWKKKAKAIFLMLVKILSFSVSVLDQE